jgi:NADPH:quinone reductase
LAALTAAVGLYHALGLPEPWVGTEERLPLVIYGASSAVGNYALQFAKRSNIHPIIAIAGRAQPYVESFLEPAKGDVFIDYRKGSEAVLNGIKDALGTASLFYAYDAISEHGSYQSICQVLKNPGGKIVVVFPRRKYEEIPEGIEKKIITVGAVHENLQDLGYVYSRYISRGLQEGWFRPLPHEVVPGGLEGVETGLRNLKEGKASALKYVFRIADTPGIEKGRL